MKTKGSAKPTPRESDAASLRKRILRAAFSAFTEIGYAETSTLEIATRAKVSKRDLYELVGNKLELLVACVTERSKRIEPPRYLEGPSDRETLSKVLRMFGERALIEVTSPEVIAVFRLAVAEAPRAPEVAKVLEAEGIAAARASLKEVLVRARTASLLDGDLQEMTDRYFALLWGDLIMRLLLLRTAPPSQAEIKGRAENAAAAFLRLFSRDPNPRCG